MQALVVDDSRVVREVAHQILDKLSFTVDEAADCDGALSACRRRIPDLILLDLNLPGASVGLFLRALRRLPDGAHVRVLLVSLENDLPLLTEGLQAGADDYILKPFDLGTISEKVKDLQSDPGN